MRALERPATLLLLVTAALLAGATAAAGSPVNPSAIAAAAVAATYPPELELLLGRPRETRAALARRTRGSLYEFFKASWHVLEPGVPFEDNWHISAFCFHIQSMLEGWLVANGHGTAEMKQRVRASWERNGLEYVDGELLVQNLIGNLAPITLKSRILMVAAPAWMWLHCPSWSFCAISSVDDNVKRDSNAHKDLVKSPWYRDTFRIDWSVRRDIDAVGEWMTTAGGERKSRSLLGGYTGVHVDALFLDDPDDAHKVHSEPMRREVQDKWKRSIKNRVKHPDRSIRIALQQRVHVDDWTSAQIAHGVWSPTDRKAWAWLVVPVHFGRGPENAPRVSPWGWTDPRTVANDNMHPARFSEAMIADEQRDRGPEGFEGQYNQNPASLDGGMIKRANIRYFRISGEPITTRKRIPGTGIDEQGHDVPALVLERSDDGRLDLEWLTVTVDCSNGGEAVTASAVGILVIGGRRLQRFCFDDRTEVLSIEGMYDAIKAAIASWWVRKVLIELKAAGASVINELKKQLANGTLLGPDGNPTIVEVVAIAPKGAAARDSKESRAAAMASSWRSGLVFLLEGADWLYPRIAGGGKVLDQGHIGEITTFPKSRRNDRVDAWSQLITYYRELPLGPSHGGFAGSSDEPTTTPAPGAESTRYDFDA